ncbi:MAG: glycosyltransferase family 4 protein [Cyanobacteria bacterium J06632_22]
MKQANVLAAVKNGIQRAEGLWADTFLASADIGLLNDNENWIFNWISVYLQRYLQERHGLSVQVNGKIRPYSRRKLLHFIDRYAYLNGWAPLLTDRHTVFMNWFHSDLADQRPHVQRLFDRLKDYSPYVSKFIASCQITEQSLLDLGVERRQIALIPLGIDLVQFQRGSPEQKQQLRQRLGIADDAICVGSFQKDGVGWGEGQEPKLEKGPDVLLQVYRQLLQRFPTLHVLLTGPARGYVKRGLEDLGIPYTHHFLERYPEVVNYYWALDLYVIAARCEGGPASLLESWATGVPLVSTRVGMPADLIRQGSNGWLAEVEAVEELVEGAIALLENADLRQRCVEQAYRDVQQYDWSKVADQYYQLYQPYLSRRE